MKKLLILQYFSISFFFINIIFCEKKNAQLFDKRLNNYWIKNWDTYSTIHDDKHYNEYLVKSRIKYHPTLYTINSNLLLYSTIYVNFSKNFYSYFTNQIFLGLKDNIPKNSSLIRNQSKFSTDRKNKYLSGFGFKNYWFQMQFGRGFENWGSGNNIQLALSSSSDPYEYLSLYSNYGKIRVKYIHGFLEAKSNSTNRYLTGRAFEWTNKESIILSLSEIVVYSGKNRQLDIGYLNPLSSHLEVELNNRLNINGDSYANAVWQFSYDQIIKDKIRFSLNYLFDEFVIDKVQIINGKEHGKAYSYQISYLKSFSKNTKLNTQIQSIHIGTPTFRHGRGENNFVQAANPLGWSEGSDTEENMIGFIYSRLERFSFSLFIGKIKYGEETILDRPYEGYKDYLKDDFPSGIIGSYKYIQSDIDISTTYNSSIYLSNTIYKKNQSELKNSSYFGIKFFF